MTVSDLPTHIESIRRFNRFYTRQIGVLEEGLVQSPYSLTEARIIYELAHHEQTTAAKLASELKLDAGYLSRILRDFAQRGLIDKQPSETDGRQTVLSLSEVGQGAFALLNSRSRNQIEAMLNGLSVADQNRLTDAMNTIESLLGSTPEHSVPYLLRPHQPGDMGWVVERHGILYNSEYGWDETFEALVAGIVSEFINNFDPKHERCWMAEMNGEIVGSVFVVKKTDDIAKLRLLIVDPKARGMGIGKRLVDECIRFSRQAGYHKMTLWTNNVLTAARHIYKSAGFQMIEEEPHHSFGYDLISETWELDL
jgi:DNA-binding MarR family transcriptional regulator/GNAT superfamily N-acetyltransferase